MNIIVDCEASGQCIGCGDLINFAAIAESGETFVSDKFAPVFDKYDISAYNAIGVTREEHLAYTGSFNEEALRFEKWIAQFKGRPTFWSDNPAFDWQWINWLFHSNEINNPFGHSARRIGDLYAGLNNDLYMQSKWKQLRRTKHTHDPLDDVKGNMEAFLEIRKRYNI
jgi:hypothetical protein